MDNYDYSPDFQCDQTGGVPTRLVVYWDKEIAWLELNDSLPPISDFEAAWKEAENACAEWGKRTCRDAADYNRLLKSLGEDAFQTIHQLKQGKIQRVHFRCIWRNKEKTYITRNT